ncbi:hypothetical protein BDV40DRAFT_105721 [Aspergillus tamarii]|uniref:Uncharacterized protein n=1 Tax=Aspergillus tamarii TaxID=41984 RepID=A0A5N6UB16_ASPTM|nr:hypothetical protein BDV40DRAFT_105721 [Aspergillus tamarii]
MMHVPSHHHYLYETRLYKLVYRYLSGSALYARVVSPRSTAVASSCYLTLAVYNSCIYSQKADNKCSCSENKCTPDSPVRRASGTCRKNQQVSDARVKLVPPSEVDIPLAYSLLHSWSDET